MANVSLTYPTDEGSREIRIEEGRISFGRGGDADYRFADDGLSRLHATVYREGDRVWIVDENSSNGTFVNGAPADAVGTPLRNGDQIRIGNNTVLNVRIFESAVTRPPASELLPNAPAAPAPDAQVPSQPFNLLPIVLIAGAFFVISISAVLIGFKVLGGGSVQTAKSDNEYSERPRADDDDDAGDTPKPKASSTAKSSDKNDSSLQDTVIPESTPASTVQLPTKKYQDMTDAEKRGYLEEKSMRIAQIIGNNSSDAIPSQAVD
ncbi:MAG TPA: hypothetical protein DEA22_12065, partial [Blastocatellia bacterium]|nr:hypothetical protein [Blastocatellia bacterium]